MNNVKSQTVLILGIGNYLLGDEGAGIHAIQLLEKKEFHLPVLLVDGGCGGFNLLSYLQDYPVVIMIDAAMDEKPAGTVTILEPSFAADFPKSLSAHDIGLRDLIESATLIGNLPKIYLITISIADIRMMSTELSQPVKDSLSTMLRSVNRILEKVYGA